MQYWLVKSEPSVYPFEELERTGRTMWEGVRNFAARNHLRAMKNSDLVLFYHSREGLEVVGVCRVVQEFYPDPTAESGDWSVVDLAPVKRLHKPVPLSVIKAVPELQQIGLVRIGRLSVMPLQEAEFQKIMELGETDFSGQ
ncbi:MAG: EVE domain-containing protein [Saprospiraceae bacterium]|jgi:predicted RNA-binding protein with PUA-like domain|nr:EVE domain-containing protein [Saprospiraceae bacterium]HRD82799.1 EVE domain-containing protein [Saprospiraceae bacterium]